MTKKEAIRAMLDGKKVKHEGDHGEGYWSYNGAFLFNGKNNSPSAMVNEGWEIYQEPKKKVKKTFWRAWCIIGDCLCPSSFYETKEDAKAASVDPIIVDWEKKVIEIDE